MNTLWKDTIGRMGCRKIAPLLVPYSDNRLGCEARARVEAHLGRCAACRDEAQSIAQVGALLRAQGMQDAVSDAAELIGPAKDLWAGIEAEIRRTERPTGTEWSPEDQLLRPRNRWAFALDASWPNRVPVVVAVFSAAVFAMVLADHSHPLAGSGAADAVKSDSQGQAISVVVRPSATIPALAARSQSQAVVAPKSSAAVFFAAKTSGATRLVAATRPARAPRASAAAPARLAVAPHSATTATLAAVAPHASAAPPHLPIATGLPAAADSLAYAPPVATPAVSPFGFSAEADTDGSANRARMVSPKLLAVAGSMPDAITTKPATETDDAPATLVSASAASRDEDATVRGDSPAAEPMADFAVLARRQRNLFSYASR